MATLSPATPSPRRRPNRPTAVDLGCPRHPSGLACGVSCDCLPVDGERFVAGRTNVCPVVGVAQAERLVWIGAAGDGAEVAERPPELDQMQCRVGVGWCQGHDRGGCRCGVVPGFTSVL